MNTLLSSAPHSWRKLLACSICLLAGVAGAANSLGIFAGATDVGNPSRAGKVEFSAVDNAYAVSGGGANMWFTNDSFHFIWTRVTGDFDLSAAVEWISPGGDPHKKACLLIRQTLEPDSPYVDVAIHGDGLTSLQFRGEEGGLTREIQANQKGPYRVALRRQGNAFMMMVGNNEREMQPSGAFIRVQFDDAVYVGLGVCAHNDAELETARFKEVELKRYRLNAAQKPVLHCTLETVGIASKDRCVIYTTTNHIEAPNWSPDGTYFLFNGSGRILRLPVLGGVPVVVDTGFARKCNNDHGISPDGKTLVISDQTRDGGKSLIYTLPVNGGTPELVTPLGPSYWHGWSPDGQTLAYCAERNGEYDIFTIPVRGGGEKRLTSAAGLDDGPDYSPDGRYIYFNSERTGLMQIWRMEADGTEQQQVTSDGFNDWFPHPSPDGKWIVFLSYDKDVEGHPANKAVRLRLMPANGGPIQELARLFGGQGTINVPSWSPDSKQLAFVSYELLLSP